MYTKVTESTPIRAVDVYRAKVGDLARAWVRSKDTCICLDLDELPWLISALQRAHAAGIAAPADQVGQIVVFDRHEETCPGAESKGVQGGAP